MNDHGSIDRFVVQQKKEWGEILSGFEGINKYAVADGGGRELYFAGETGGSTLGRWFLKASRPFTIQLLTPTGQPFMRVERPFRFYFHEASIYDAGGALIGSIRKRFTLLRRRYSVLDASETEIYEFLGPIFRPWTFRILQNGREIGRITKNWSGLLKEAFTDADNFSVTFPPDLENGHKTLFLGAVFLIDFVHFENKSNN